MTMPLVIRNWMARAEAATNGYLQQVGWFVTRSKGRALDPDGNPIPWFTYPAIRLLEQRVRPDWRVLEFGAGMGTLWWSQRVHEVVAIEHDAAWADLIASRSSARVLPGSASDPAGYVDKALACGTFQVVIVDGLFRQECLDAVPGLLAPGGVAILDDAQRPEYTQAVAALRQHGFKALELHGPQPVSKHPGCTALFYRRENVLDL